MGATLDGTVRPPRCHPFFMDTGAGRLFALHHSPAPGTDALGHLLMVPPFNEEMNRCRSMMTLQAQALAALGVGTLVIDLFGTGDSEGDYVDCRWDLWLANVESALAWLDRQPGGCLGMLGIRLGAILAAQVHARRSDPGLNLVLWQPVVDGKVHLNQFMRVKIAAQMDRADLPKLTTATMRQQWQAGQSVEIAGYEIHPDLAAAIEGASLAPLRLAAGTHLLWLEQAVGDSAELGAASRKLLQLWPGDEVNLKAALFEGPPFWQVHERALAPNAIDHTTRWLNELWAKA